MNRPEHAEPLGPDRAAEMIERYLQGGLPDEELELLESALKADPALVEPCADAIQIAALVREARRDGSAHDSIVSTYDRAVDYADLFAALRPPGDVAPVELAGRRGGPRLAVPAAWRLAAGAAAALIVLSALIYVVVSGLSGPSTPQVARTPAPAAPSTRAVATLTAERDAVWERRPGQDLYTGQRLTLTEGFAEITTKRGAVAIIQAPATVELLESDNALRLHAGKLVGICETESSKGFLVRTPHMDVTDLGTRFVVDSRSPGRTDVFVYEGEVEVAPSGPSGGGAIARHRLAAGQAMRADASGGIASLAPSDHGLGMLPAVGLSGLTGYEAVVTELNPVAWWRQQSASPQADVLGDVVFSENRPPMLGVVTLDGRGALDAGDVLSFDTGQAFTMSCWIRPEVTDHAFIAGRVGSNDQRGVHGYDLYLDRGRLYFHLMHAFNVPGKPNRLIRVCSPALLTKGRWTQVTAVYDGSGRASGIRLSINAEEVPVTVIDDSLGDRRFRAETHFRIGIRGFALPLPDGRSEAGRGIHTKAGSPFVGDLGEMLIFDRALSKPEVESIYRESKDSYQPDQSQPAARLGPRRLLPIL